MYGTTQPPNLKPHVGSSSGPPGACITPSNDTNAPVMTLRISVLRFGKARARALGVAARSAFFAVSRTNEPERCRQAVSGRIAHALRLVPAAGLEPAASRLQGGCSTVELRRPAFPT